MIITIALGVMLGLFLTGLVARVLSDEGCLTGLAWTFWIVVAIFVLLQLPPQVALVAVVCLLIAWFVIALTQAVRRNGGRWVKGEPLVELQRELEERWPRITGLGPQYKGDAGRWTRAVDLSCGHTLQSQDVRLKKGRAFYCALCNPELLDIYQQFRSSMASRGSVQHGHFGAYLSGVEWYERKQNPWKYNPPPRRS